jgi:exopolysaccharide production protein ExoZ
MYWIATSLKLIVLLFTASYWHHSQIRVANIIDSYLFLPSHNSGGSLAPVLDVGWTLNCEMFFYFLFTLALLFRMNVYRFVGAVFILLAVFGFFRRPDWPAASFYLSTVFLQFFYGMVIARVCQTRKNIPVHFALPLLGLGFLCLIGPWSSANQLYGMGNGLAAALIVYSMASLEDSLTRIPGYVLYGADASYVIYLFFTFFAPLAPDALLKFHLLHPWLSVGCSVFLALAAGCLIHQLIEAPITRWSQVNVLIGSKTVNRLYLDLRCHLGRDPHRIPAMDPIQILKPHAKHE